MMEKGTGTSTNRSSSSRLNVACGRTCTTTYRSPVGPPSAPCSPSPCMRRRWPSAMPAGIRTVTRRSRVVRPRPRQVGARLPDDLAGSGALGTGPGHDEEALLEPELTRAPAVRTGLGRGSGRGARAAAGLAVLLARDLNGRLGAGVGLLERDLEIEAQIGAARRPVPTPPATEAEEVAEDVGEIREDVGVEPRAGPGLARHAGVPEPIVSGALLGIAEHRVGLGGLLEAFLRGVVARIAVRMVLEGEFPVCALDVLIARVARDTEHLVVVALTHACATFTSDGRSRREPRR